MEMWVTVYDNGGGSIAVIGLETLLLIGENMVLVTTAMTVYKFKSHYSWWCLWCGGDFFFFFFF